MQQIRVACENIRQPTGRHRIGASEFDHRWRTARLVVVGIQGQGVVRSHREPKIRIYAAERVIAHQGRRLIESRAKLADIRMDAVALQRLRAAVVAQR